MSEMRLSTNDGNPHPCCTDWKTEYLIRRNELLNNAGNASGHDDDEDDL